MYRTELSRAVAKSTGLSLKDVDTVVLSVFEEMASALASGEKVTIISFGSFTPVLREARKARNPQHPEQVIAVPEKKAVRFKAANALKSELNA